MPTYDYKCEACGFEFEKFQSMSSRPVRKCPKCGKNRVKRLIGTGAGLIFKGSGFYITDYRGDAYKSAAKADNGSPPPSKDAKPATTTEPASKPAAESKPAIAPSKPAAPEKPAKSSSK